MICICGCNKEINVQKHHKYHPPKYIHGHNMMGKKPFNEKPNSLKKSTGYARLRKIVDAKKTECELMATNQCMGPLEIHHKDKNPCNNVLNNLSTLCKSHHRLIELESITYDKPMADFYTDGSGKRRYTYINDPLA